MVVKRNNNGSVNIENDNGSIAVGRMNLVSNDKKKETFKLWVEECAKKIKANYHTFEETEKYFLEQCDALPLEAEDKRVKNFQYNVIENSCKDKLIHKPAEFSFDMTDEEMESWKKNQDGLREEIMNSSPEKFGLIIRGYYLPHTKRNEVIYEQVIKREEQEFNRIRQSRMNSNNKMIRLIHRDICFFFEETTEQFHSDSSNALIKQLIIFRGITENDIEKRTPRFLMYISFMKEEFRGDYK